MTKMVVHVIDNRRIEMHGGSEFVREVSSEDETGGVSRTFAYGVLKLDELKELIERGRFGTGVWLMAGIEGRKAILSELEER